jgi:hypothetical protein
MAHGACCMLHRDFNRVSDLIKIHNIGKKTVDDAYPFLTAYGSRPDLKGGSPDDATPSTEVSW